MTNAPPSLTLRQRLGNTLFERVAGANGHEARKQVHGAVGPRWFPKGAAIRQVHGDASMWVGGLRALLLQSLHPVAMAGVAGHSGYRGDPWGRLERTSNFLAFTTFGTAEDAQATVDRIRAVHERVRGTTPEGEPYRASDPHLLMWVHIAEVDSFLAAHAAFGKRPLDAERRDEYLAQTARVVRELGADDAPTTYDELQASLEAYRPELRATDAAKDTAKFLLEEPPLERAARGPYRLIAAGAVALLPRWAQDELEIGGWPTRTFGRAGGAIATRTIRWGLSAALPDYPSA